MEKLLEGEHVGLWGKLYKVVVEGQERSTVAWTKTVLERSGLASAPFVSAQLRWLSPQHMDPLAVSPSLGLGKHWS